MGIAEALRHVNEKMCASAIKSGRNPDAVTLVAVSKRIELQKIIEALKAGVIILGENRVQEAKSKIVELGAKRTDVKPVWHLIGHLQKNKAKAAVELFQLIHSIDSEELAGEINRQAEKAGKRQHILIQVKLSDEPAKHGVGKQHLMKLMDRVADMKNLHLEGLMTMPPYFEDPERTRPYYRKLRQLAETVREKGFPVHELSMGMSNDYDIAIEEGSTMVRVGTAIFGERKYEQ